MGASGDQFLPFAGDILLTQESVTSVGLYRLCFDGASLQTEELRATADSATLRQ
jgi:hypothetical protein